MQLCLYEETYPEKVSDVDPLWKEIAPATLDDSPTVRFLTEHFPDDAEE
jgi:hypothetical protein